MKQPPVSQKLKLDLSALLAIPKPDPIPPPEPIPTPPPRIPVSPWRVVAQVLPVIILRCRCGKVYRFPAVDKWPLVKRIKKTRTGTESWSLATPPELINPMLPVIHQEIANTTHFCQRCLPESRAEDTSWPDDLEDPKTLRLEQKD